MPETALASAQGLLQVTHAAQLVEALMVYGTSSAILDYQRRLGGVDGDYYIWAKEVSLGQYARF